MGYTTQLGAPTKDVLQKGRYTLHRWHRSEATVAAPIVATNLEFIEAIDIGEPSFDEEDVYQQGGGDERTKVRTNWMWSGTITVKKGKIGNVLATLQGRTWASGTAAVQPLKAENDYVNGHWEAICRKQDNTDHLFTLLIQDMILDNAGFTNPMDYSDVSIPFHTYHEPVLVCEDVMFVYDQFNGDGSTVDFTASATPLTALTASNYDDWFLDKAIFVKEKASTASTGTRKKSGYSEAAGVFTATTAPAVGTTVQVGYFATAV